MESLSKVDAEEQNPSRVSSQAIWFVAHCGLAIAAWLVLMLLGYAFNPTGISQMVILLLSLAVPMLAGLAVTTLRQDQMATRVWLIGLIWLLIISLYVLDMPTAPNQCLKCDATDKLTRTLFSWPQPSGLIDDDGPFLGTWPAAALIGYSIGARFGLRRKG
jgi:hypothetical protein